jgi:hypothetical protein
VAVVNLLHYQMDALIFKMSNPICRENIGPLLSSSIFTENRHEFETVENLAAS